MMEETNKQLMLLSEHEQKHYRYELSKLDDTQQARLEALVVRMVQSGATRPLSWAWSEFREDIPQWARFMVIKSMYQSAYDVAGNVDGADEFSPGSSEIYEELLAITGAEKLNHFFASYGKALLYNMLDILDEGNTDYECNDSWQLVTYYREKGKSGRPISALHEDFLEFDAEINSFTP